MVQLHLHLFGPPRIERDGALVAIDTRKAIAALAYLAVGSRGGVSSRDGLAALLYPDYSQERAKAAFRRTLSALRSGIGADLLDADRETVRLVLDGGFWCDATCFEALIARCEQHGHQPSQVCSECLGPLTEAAGLYGGDFMAGFSLRDSISFDDWQLMQTETLRRAYSSVLERLVHGRGAQERWQEAIDLCHRWIALDPLHEPAQRRLMQLYAWNGQRSAALRQYRECVRILDEELGVPPLPETTALYQAIVEGTDSPPAVAGDEWNLVPHTHDRAVPASPPAKAGAPALAARPDSGSFALVGRDQPLAFLLERYEQASSRQFILIEGEAGIGKTRLAEEFMRRVLERGGAVISSRCYEDDARQAYGPVVDALRAGLAMQHTADRLASLPELWLAEVRRLAPELSILQPGAPPPVLLEGAGAQARFFEGIAQAFLAMLDQEPPGVLFLDDLQWADEATLDVLAFLVRRTQGKSLAIAGTLRNEGSAATDVLHRLLAEASRQGHGASVTLDRLSPEAVGELAGQAALQALSPAAIRRLYEETEGIPLFVVGFLAGLEDGLLPAPDDAWTLPTTVRQLLEARLSTVDDIGRQLLTAAAVIGRSFPFDTLRAVSGRGEEEVVVGLETIAAAGLIRELRGNDQPANEASYDFTHEQLRRVVYDGASLARRRLLHRRAADALVHDGAPAGQIARHFQLAGNDQQAAGYYRLAGEHARGVFANNEALNNFETALALGHPDAAGLHEAIGDLRTLQGMYFQALMAYETAAAVADPGRLALLEHKLGQVHMRQGQWDLAESRFEAAAGDGGSPAWQAALYADWTMCALRRGDAWRAASLARQALERAEASGDDRALARTSNVLGVLARSQADPAAAGRHLQASLAAARRLGDVPAQIAALNNLALTARDLADDRQAQQYLEEALALCTRVGDVHHQAALHNNLADLLHRRGQEDQAMQHLKQAVQIFAEVGQRPAEPVNWEPEIWKLAEW